MYFFGKLEIPNYSLCSASDGTSLHLCFSGLQVFDALLKPQIIISLKKKIFGRPAHVSGKGKWMEHFLRIKRDKDLGILSS